MPTFEEISFKIRSNHFSVSLDGVLIIMTPILFFANHFDNKSDIKEPLKPIIAEIKRREFMLRSTPCSSKTPSIPNTDIEILNINSIAILVPRKSAILSIKVKKINKQLIFFNILL